MVCEYLKKKYHTEENQCYVMSKKVYLNYTLRIKGVSD